MVNPGFVFSVGVFGGLKLNVDTFEVGLEGFFVGSDQHSRFDRGSVRSPNEESDLFSVTFSFLVLQVEDTISGFVVRKGSFEFIETGGTLAVELNGLGFLGVVEFEGKPLDLGTRSILELA